MNAHRPYAAAILLALALVLVLALGAVARDAVASMRPAVDVQHTGDDGKVYAS